LYDKTTLHCVYKEYKRSIYTNTIFTDSQLNLLKISKFNQHEVERSPPDGIVYKGQKHKDDRLSLKKRRENKGHGPRKGTVVSLRGQRQRRRRDPER